ncbi:MAG: regulatory protein RecX [Proteobacteria bacterium]|nr:regulatory protein RecX [Pseudomonadota bacterium]
MQKVGTGLSIRNVAMNLLARREHSAYELKQKLKLRDFDVAGIDAALELLQQDRLQSDSRFTENYVHHRVNAGFGPIKIRHELRQKGVGVDLVDEYLPRSNRQWDALMERQRIKKFGQEIPADYPLRMKQARFLQNRGFSPEAVMRLFR